MGLTAIGDIHGCPGTLEELLNRLDPTPADHLVFIGDYVDRGPDSRSVIERLLSLRESVKCTFLRGNHEALMLEGLDEGVTDLWFANGGQATLQSYAQNGRVGRVPEHHLAFVRDTESYYETDEFLFIHGGLKPRMSVEENLRRYDDEVFLWERSHLEAARLKWEKTVVCGHTPIAEPINEKSLIAIDTGCVFFTRPHLGRLTAVRLPEREFLSVDYAG